MKLRVPSIPPHIRWPMLVVAFLVSSISWSSYTFYKAQSDGGPAIVENYYQKGKAWNATAQAQTAGRALDVELHIGEATGENHMRMVEIVVRDSTGAPVELSGMLRGLRPHKAKAVASVPLRPVRDRPGTYQQMLPLRDAGLWDFEIDAERGTTAVQKTIRRTL
jgi:nitrogen fixation protein FixH